jgi:FMN phosphatase YigB (HAD superfamily)
VRVVFLLDVDNTLLDNDALKDRCDRELRGIGGDGAARRFWAIYEEVRALGGVIDYPTTLARFLRERPDLPGPTLEALVMDAPFATFVYPGALALVERMWQVGEPAILSDGDAVYQPRKIERSGLAAAVRGNVLVYPHKEDHLDEVMLRFPADHYVQVDDKASLLATTKGRLGTRVTTVHVRQGHYANDPPG